MEGDEFRLIGITLAIFASACASLPTHYPIPEHSTALHADASTRLGAYEAVLAQTHGEEKSGFEPIDANGDGLWWRLALVDEAERSLDLQYYLWYDNAGGLLLLHHVVAAADRGVRVRMLIDDFQYMTDKQGLVDLSAHPQIEIRIFNPWAGKGYTAGPKYLARFDRLDHRMHNKLLEADNQAVIFRWVPRSLLMHRENVGFQGWSRRARIGLGQELSTS